VFYARSPSIAAVFSFLLPGLGQLSLGAVRRGVLLASPAVAVFVAAIALAVGARGLVLETLLRADVLVALLVLNVVLAAYHVGAIADAYRLASRLRVRRPGIRRASSVLLAGVLIVTLVLHGALEAIGYQAYQTLQSVFVPAEPGGAWTIPEPSFEDEPTPTAPPSPSTSPTVTPRPSPSASLRPTPSPTPRWAADDRLNLLLIGSDAGPDRWSLRTDTIIILSVDVTTRRAALFGIPRNLVGVPLPPESAAAFTSGRFPGLINALYVYAMGHPNQFPGGDARGFRAVSGAVQELVGVRLDAVVVVNLAGFVRLVDAIGGLWINVPERLTDEHYPLEDGSGLIKLDIQPGCQRLDGRMALAYARSRHQDSDYGRMARQQAVLVALARQVDPMVLLPRVPRLLDIAQQNLWTTIRREDVPGLVALADRVNTARVKTVLFVPSRYPSHLDSAEITQIRGVVRSVFDGAWTGSSRPPVPACP
jgi:polyisoprenyl-teichoic acid--peptidoglycan teichoic acid transferase